MKRSDAILIFVVTIVVGFLLYQLGFDSLIAAVFVVLAGLFYFLPGIIANLRNHHNTQAIFLLNLLLGWTALGWIIALIWAFTNPPHATSRNSHQFDRTGKNEEAPKNDLDYPELT